MTAVDDRSARLGGHCEAIGCDLPARRFIYTAGGCRTVCTRCAVEWEAIHDRRPVDGFLVLAGLGLVALGGLLALVCGLWIVTAVRLDAGLAWVRWAGLAGGGLGALFGWTLVRQELDR